LTDDTGAKNLKNCGSGLQVGVDVGGTFTDFVAFRGDSLSVHKIPSTPRDQSDAVISGLRDMGVKAADRIVYGSTVATNTLLERKGPRCALITTKGFRDVLEIGRQTRSRLYDLDVPPLDPLIRRDLRFEVDERVASDGSVLRALSEEDARRAVSRALKAGAESLAVCFLFSFIRPEHERLVQTIAADAFEFCTISSDILPEFREYERLATTVVNAYVGPVAGKFFARLERRLRARRLPRPHVMQSNGGVISLGAASREPVRTILSGPAGGIVAAQAVAREVGIDEIITFDMGGTSTDVALAAPECPISKEFEIAGVPVKVPMLDIHTVGAGGGSIAKVDAGSALKVGPESAGADPGPACYGKGDDVTVTDANLLLGRLREESFLGGAMALDRGRAEARMQELAGRLHLQTESVASGIVRVANARVARALRRISVERGHDPRNFVLVAYGGCGPLHACELAEALEMPAVLIPRCPGVLSALGLAMSQILREYSITVMEPSEGAMPSVLRVLKRMKTQAASDFDAEGVPEADREYRPLLDMRYTGQSHELEVALRDESRLSRRYVIDFHARHLGHFGYSRPGAATEIVNVRLRALGLVRTPRLRPMQTPRDHVPEPAAQAEAFGAGSYAPCRVFNRDDLEPGARLEGPSLVLQADSTTWIPPRWSGVVDPYLNLALQRDSKKSDADGV
jgi:N-methylhydantoinase A